jgi:hypothetical protein
MKKNCFKTRRAFTQCVRRALKQGVRALNPLNLFMGMYSEFCVLTTEFFLKHFYAFKVTYPMFTLG